MRGSGHSETTNKLLEDALPASGAGVDLFDALLYGRIEETNTNVDISLLREVDHKTLAKDKLVRNNLMYDKLGMAPQYDYTPPRLDHAREARMLSDYIFYTPESRELIMHNHHSKKNKVPHGAGAHTVGQRSRGCHEGRAFTLVLYCSPTELNVAGIEPQQPHLY